VLLSPEIRERLLSAAIARPPAAIVSRGAGSIATERVSTCSWTASLVRLWRTSPGNGAMVGARCGDREPRARGPSRGLEVAISQFPCGTDQDLVASFELFAAPNERTEVHWRDELVEAIGERHTNRRRGRRHLEPVVVARLVEAVRSIPGAELQVCQDEEDLEAIGRLIGAGDRLRYLHPECNSELFNELRWTPEEAEAKRDGISLESLELTRTDRAGLEICRRLPTIRLVREWGGGEGLSKPSFDAVVASSAVGLLTMPRAERSSFFLGGRAMERMWLAAHVHRLAIHPMTTLAYLFARVFRGQGEGLDAMTIETAKQLRGPYCELFELEDDTAEVLLFRISHAEATEARSLRRPLGEVLVIG
jgi:hypothetical protein